MLKLKTFIEDKYRRFWFALAINIFLFIFFNCFFYCRYHTVDDVFMEMFACGAYGQPDHHLIYTNAILGFILQGLYTLLPSVPWYGLMHILMALLSLSAITYVFLNRDRSYVGYLALLAVFIVSYEAYTKVQFTKTAAYLACAGYILIAYSLEIDKTQRIRKQIGGVIFLWNSFMIRTGMFLGVSAVCLGCLLPLILSCFKDKTRLKELKELFMIGLCSLFIVGISYAIDAAAYRSEGWAYYKKFNEYTTQFQDINLADYDEFEKEYNELGIDRDDVRLYRSTDHNDPDLFDLDTMEKVRQLQPYKPVNMDEFVMFVLRGYNTLFRQKSLATFTAFTIFILLLFVFGCKTDWISWLSLIFTGLAAFFAFAYTYFMHGWFDRTTLSIMTAVIFTVLYLLKPRKNKVIKGLIMTFLLVSIVGSLVIWSEYFRWNMEEWKQDYQLNHEVLDMIYEDQDHLYISRTTLPVWKRYYTPYEQIRRGAMANYSPFGDWIANNPLLVRTLKNYDVVNPFRDIVNNPKVYYIGEEDNMDLVMTYIRKHYYPSAEAVFVDYYGPYLVYSIVAG